MHIKSFLKLVEIQTKIASIIPLILGTLYCIYRFNLFNTKNFILLLLSVLCFDMATTAVNNYYDYKRAIKKNGYNYEQHNAIVRDSLSIKSTLTIIVILLFIASSLGIVLVLNTNLIVLIIGVVSFFVGICYSFGPLPISRTPLGEVFSGFFMGFIITFLSVYIHIVNINIVSININSAMLGITINISEILFIFFISIPSIFGIANIMLANNICDIEDDKQNFRYTLPIYIGRENALKLFSSLYYISYIGILFLVVVTVLPFYYLLCIFTIVPVFKNINVFKKQQTKKDTFAVSVKNFMIINLSLIIMFIVSITFNVF